MNFLLNKLISIFKELCGNNNLEERVRSLERMCFLKGGTYHRCSAISNLLILQLGQVDQYPGSRMFHLQEVQDGCSIISDGYVLPQITQMSSEHQETGKPLLTPTSSTNILSSPTGPRELLTMLAMELAAKTAGNKGQTESGVLLKSHGFRHAGITFQLG